MYKFYIFLIFLVFSGFVEAGSVNFLELKTKLDSTVPKILKEQKAPGVAIAIVEEDRVVGVFPYGLADIESKKAINKETMFNIGSISKVVTTWGVMQLVEQGKVELDQPINQYLKRWKIPPSTFNTEKVTLRNILSHTSGLSLGPYVGWDTPSKVPSIVDSLKGNNNGAGSLELLHSPNTKWSYSGGGYSVVQLLIEDVSGLSFEQYMQQNVFKPLGMKNTTFDITNEIMKKSATPYDHLGKKTSMLYFAEKAAAGLQTTALDLARFNLAILKNAENKYNGAHLLSQRYIEEMITPAPNTDGRWSMSYVVDTENTSLGFAGFNRGWISLSRSITDKNIGYVILTNSSINGVSNRIDDLLLNQLTSAKDNQL